MNFADADAVPAEIAACGGVGAMDLPSFVALDLPDQVSRVRAEWQHATPRLLVFDNYEDEQLLFGCGRAMADITSSSPPIKESEIRAWSRQAMAGSLVGRRRKLVWLIAGGM